MKRLNNITTQITGTKLTITADIEDHTFEQPVQRVTVNNHNPINMHWPRHCQISHEAYFVKAFGTGFGIMHDDLVKIAYAVEPKITFPPKFRNDITPSLSIEWVSEIPMTIQWQSSPDGKTWENIAGQESKSLDKTLVEERTFVRCVATNAAGATATDGLMVQ